MVRASPVGTEVSLGHFRALWCHAEQALGRTQPSETHIKQSLHRR